MTMLQRGAPKPEPERTPRHVCTGPCPTNGFFHYDNAWTGNKTVGEWGPGAIWRCDTCGQDFEWADRGECYMWTEL